MMKTLYLIRHGESNANQGGITQPNKKLPLSDKGKVQAQQIAAIMAEQLTAPANIYASEMYRAQQTAEHFCAPHEVSPYLLPCLNEFSIFDHRDIEGLTGEQRRPLTNAYWQRANPNERTGELADTFVEFNDRVERFLMRLSEFEDQSICFGHGLWIALLNWRLAGFADNGIDAHAMRNFRNYQQALPVPNASIWQLRFDEESSLMQLKFIAQPVDD